MEALEVPTSGKEEEHYLESRRYEIEDEEDQVTVDFYNIFPGNSYNIHGTRDEEDGMSPPFPERHKGMRLCND